MRRTTPQQFQKIVSLMEANPDVAAGMGKFGSTKSSRAEMWESFAVELNALGPPIRNGREWNKVWLDYKLKLKKKIAANRTETTATGGGPYAQRSLTALEQSVDELLHLQEAANPPGNTFGINMPENATTSNMAESTASARESQPEDSDDDEENLSPTPTTVTPRSSTPRPRMTVDDRENIRLREHQKQTQVQDSLYKGILKFDQQLDEIARYSRKSYELKKEELKILKAKEERKKEENLEKKRQHKEKMEMKLKEIELKALKYKLRK